MMNKKETISHEETKIKYYKYYKIFISFATMVLAFLDAINFYQKYSGKQYTAIAIIFLLISVGSGVGFIKNLLKTSTN